MISVVTDSPVALTSPDHLHPWGTMRDNSVNERFNDRLLSILMASHWSVLDLGCSGGGFVRSLLDRGVLAVGIEGSDYSKSRGRAEWATIPEYLHTADITAQFDVCRDGDLMRFGAVTLWEVIEHIAEDDLPQVMDNVDHHLMPGGVVVMSISHVPDVVDGASYHQTVQPREWWLRTLENLGWISNPIVDHFCGDFVRGGQNAPGSSHVVLHRLGCNPAIRHPR